MEEMGIPYPQPYKLQIDNAAAKTFAKNTAGRTKLKHIDSRLDWVKTLRNSEISEPVSVPTEVNLGDMFTKILSKSVFLNHRNRCLHRVPSMPRYILRVSFHLLGRYISLIGQVSRQTKAKCAK